MQKDNLKIEIGGLCSLIQVEDLSFLNALKERYKKFISKNTPDIIVNTQMDWDNNSVVDSELTVILDKGEAIFNRNDMQGKINLKNNKVSLKIASNILSFDSFLRILYSLIMLKNNGFLVHAAGIVKKNGGYLFAGPESSGKSTMARSFPSHMVASDEVIIIRKQLNHFLLCGTPFTGDIKEGRNIKAKVKKFFILTREKNTCFRELSVGEAMSGLLQNIIFFTGSVSLNKKLLELSYSFCKSVSYEKLTF